jgi:hypothetical protein
MTAPIPIPESVYEAAADTESSRNAFHFNLRVGINAAIAEYERTRPVDVGTAQARTDLVAANARAEKWIKDYHDVADALAKESSGPDHLCRIARQLRADLATEQKERDRIAADLAAAQKRIGELEEQVILRTDMCEERWVNLKKAESALTRAGYVRDGGGEWKAPAGKSPRRYRATVYMADGKPNIHHGFDDAGDWVLYRDVAPSIWEAPPCPLRVTDQPRPSARSPREAALEVLKTYWGDYGAAVTADAIHAYHVAAAAHGKGAGE